MNNLLNKSVAKTLLILLALCSTTLNADQGMLKSFENNTTFGITTSSSSTAIALDDSYSYTISGTKFYRYDINGSNETTKELNSNTNALTIDATKAYVATDAGLRIITLLNISNTQELNTTEAETEKVNSVVIDKNSTYAYLGQSDGVSVVKLSGGVAAEVAKITNGITDAKDIVIYRDYLYVANDWGKLQVIDITNPETAYISSTDDKGDFYALSVENNYLYALGKKGLTIYDISNPAVPLVQATDLTMGTDVLKECDITVYDQYAYVTFSNTLQIYDVSNKKIPKKSVIDDISPANSTISSNGDIYVSSTSGVSKYDVDSDYKNDLNRAKSDTENQGFFSRDLSQNGIFGTISSNTDIDYIKLNIPSGIFVATLSGMADINATLYDSSGNIKFTATDANSSKVEISKTLDSSTYYLMIKSNSGETGEYKLKAEFNPDEWTDFLTDAPLINFGETMRGNMLGSSDKDIFRVDLSSKGTLTIDSSYEDVVKFEVKNSYNTTIIQGNATPYKDGKKFEIPQSGIYYIVASSANNDISDDDYRFRVNFSRGETLAKEDDAPLTINSLEDINTTGELNHIKVDGDFIYATLQDGSDNKLQKRNISDLTLSKEITLDPDFEDFEVVGNYIYMLYRKKVVSMHRDSISEMGSVIFANGDLKKIRINATRLYAVTDSQVAIFDISSREAMTLLTEQHIGNINDFDMKTSYMKNADGTYSIHTYLYFATSQNGLKVYDVTDENNIEETQVYGENHHFSTITIANPFAYVSCCGEMQILYIKKPTARPKFKGSVGDVGGIQNIAIGQDFAFITTHDGYLNIVDIKDQTAPKVVEFNQLNVAQNIAVSKGVAYAIRPYTTSKTALIKYDVAKDYADVKGGAKELKYDQNISGVISTNRPADKDLFYIDAKRSTELDFKTDGNISLSLFSFHDDVNKSMSDNKITLSRGEYYLVVETNNSKSGSYTIFTKKIEDDHGDTYIDATPLSFTKDTNGTFSSTDDADFFKIVLDDRAEITVDTNATYTLYYDDGVTAISKVTTLNPGTYYLKLTGTGNYTIKVTATPNGELTIPSGVGGILNFNAKHVVYADRYIYTVDNKNQLASYNHLLKSLNDEPKKINFNALNTCSKPFIYNNIMFFNTGQYNENKLECKYGYHKLDIEMTDGNDNYNHISSSRRLYNIGEELSEKNIITIQEGSIYEYANNRIVKISYLDLEQYDVLSLGLLDIGSYTFKDIKDLKADANLMFVAIGNQLQVINTSTYHPRHIDNNVSLGYITETLTDLKVAKTFNINVTKMIIQRGANELYVIDDSSSLKKLTYTNSSFTLSNVKTLLDTPNDFYEKDDIIYISFKDYGIQTYNIKTEELISYPNIGKNIANPFSYDGSTVNYTSDGQLKVFFIEDSFLDGSTTGTYSIVDKDSVDEGEGCFIATAGYGSYFQKDVKVLRDFRDTYLLNNFLGRVFVDFYYQNSPAIAKDIAKSELAKQLVRIALTPVVFAIKYPLAIFVLLMLFIGFTMRNGFFASSVNRLKHLAIIPLLIISTMTLTGCSDDDDKAHQSSADRTKNPPKLQNLLVNIDTNNTKTANIKVGYISNELGGSEILSFRLDGAGRSNFDISKSGVITTNSLTELDCKKVPKYDLTAVAQNSFGDSNKVDVIIQVNCMDVPIMKDLSFHVMENSFVNETISFTRTDENSTDTSNIKEIRLYGDDAYMFKAEPNGSLSLQNQHLDYEHKRAYNLTARAINNKGKIGPASKITIAIGDIDENDGGYYDGGNSSYGDDYPDNYSEASHISVYQYSDNQSEYISGRIDYAWDTDYIKMELTQTSTIQLSINSYTNDSGLAVTVYKESNGNLSHRDSTTLYGSGSLSLANQEAGTYFIEVRNSSEGSYNIGISINGSNTQGSENPSPTTDEHGDTIAESTLLNGGSSITTTLTRAGAMNYTDDKDYFSFTLDSRTSLDINTISSFDTYGTLFDSNGIPIFNNDDDGSGSNFSIDEVLDAGTYYIEVRGYSEDLLGDYNLVIAPK